ncbi:hypothetical protein Pcinc_036372 [Petrolisthes cinctipes]|uniref:Uncharacterized protein n=1 Tax=Petrolisthes cinctipes TaxID=88211 RepID=A0AAE1BUL6_PETCI|nr:hypothetical protein Pcinc_036372 [Petrolisthes cinctipes]
MDMPALLTPLATTGGVAWWSGRGEDKGTGYKALAGLCHLCLVVPQPLDQTRPAQPSPRPTRRTARGRNNNMIELGGGLAGRSLGVSSVNLSQSHL